MAASGRDQQKVRSRGSRVTSLGSATETSSGVTLAPPSDSGDSSAQGGGAVAPSGAPKAVLVPGALVSLAGGRFILVQEIGRGSMGIVYEARHDPLGHRMAIKALHPHIAQNPSVIWRFKREAQITASLKHPNIVSVFDVAKELGDIYFLIEELLEDADPPSLRRRSVSQSKFRAIRPPLDSDPGGESTGGGAGALAEQALATNSLPRAVELAERAISEQPSSARIKGRMRLVQAIACQWMGKLVEAERYAQVACRHLPKGSARWFAAVGNLTAVLAGKGEREFLLDPAENLMRAQPNRNQAARGPRYERSARARSRCSARIGGSSRTVRSRWRRRWQRRSRTTRWTSASGSIWPRPSSHCTTGIT